MRYLLAIALILTTGCAELHEHAIGTRVHQFSVKGRDYVHCSILVDKAQPQMTHEALELCRAGIEAATVPEPQKQK